MANKIIRPGHLPPRGNPVASEVVPSDNGSIVAGVTWVDGVNAGRPLASQNEAEAGVNATKAMTPLTTKQSIASEVGVSLASKAQGDLAVSSIQTITAGANISVDYTDPKNLIISSSGGVGDGDKGGVVVSGSGTVWTVKAFTGDSGTGGALGGVPAPAAGDAVADKVLGANGTWIPRRASADAVYSVCEELTNTIPIGAIPPNTAGTEIVWANFAASSATAKVRVRFVGYAIHKTADNGLAAILIMDGETSARAAACANPIGAGYMVPIVLEYVFSPGDTANHLYIIRAGATDGVMLMNGFTAGTPAFGGMLRSRLLVEEI